jgi:hypothetical protein
MFYFSCDVEGLPLIVSAVEFLEVEFSTCRLARPKTEVVGGWSVETWNRHVKCNGLHNLAAFPNRNRLSVVVLVFSDVTIKLDLYNSAFAAKVIEKCNSRAFCDSHQRRCHVSGIPKD